MLANWFPGLVLYRNICQLSQKKRNHQITAQIMTESCRIKRLLCQVFSVFKADSRWLCNFQASAWKKEKEGEKMLRALFLCSITCQGWSRLDNNKPEAIWVNACPPSVCFSSIFFADQTNFMFQFSLTGWSLQIGGLWSPLTSSAGGNGKERSALTSGAHLPPPASARILFTATVLWTLRLVSLVHPVEEQSAAFSPPGHSVW